MPYTQRPDRFCQGLLEGPGGADGGRPPCLAAPGTIDQFFKTGQDRAFHWMTASILNLVRWFCALVTVLLPGLYIAVVTFHPEAIPVKLAPVHCGRKTGGALFHRVRGAHYAPGL